MDCIDRYSLVVLLYLYIVIIGGWVRKFSEVYIWI